MKECPECGSKMLVEIYKNSIYVYFQHNCVGCGNRGNEKYFNDEGDIRLQKILYGRANDANKLKDELYQKARDENEGND